jgi:hypothetical protein
MWFRLEADFIVTHNKHVPAARSPLPSDQSRRKADLQQMTKNCKSHHPGSVRTAGFSALSYPPIARQPVEFISMQVQNHADGRATAVRIRRPSEDTASDRLPGARLSALAPLLTAVDARGHVRHYRRGKTVVCVDVV